MGTKRDWRKAKQVGPTEDFRGGGVELKNGEVTAMPRRDKLGQRADRGSQFPDVSAHNVRFFVNQDVMDEIPIQATYPGGLKGISFVLSELALNQFFQSRHVGHFPHIDDGMRVGSFHLT